MPNHPQEHNVESRREAPPTKKTLEEKIADVRREQVSANPRRAFLGRRPTPNA